MNALATASRERDEALAAVTRVREIAQRWSCDHDGFDEVLAALGTVGQDDSKERTPAHSSECRYHDAHGCASQPRMEPNYNPWVSSCCDRHHYSCWLGDDDPPVRCCDRCPAAGDSEETER